MPRSPRSTAPTFELTPAEVAGANGLDSRDSKVVCLAALIGLGLFFRYYRVLQTSLWGDETFTLRIVSLDLRDFFALFTSGQDLHPPAYYFFLWLVDRLFPGESPTLLLRLTSATVLVGTLAAVYVLSKRSSQPTNFLLLAGVCFALSPAGVYLDGELRMYGALLAESLWILVAAEYRLSHPSRPVRSGIGLGAASTLASLTHYVGVLIAVAALIALLVAQRRRFFDRRFLISLSLPILVLWIPWATVLVSHVPRSKPYPMGLEESLRFVMLVLGPFGIFVVLLAGYQAMRRSAATSAVRAPLSMFVSSIALLAICLLLTGENLLTLGVAAATVSSLVVAAARSVLWDSRRALLLCVVIGSLCLPAALALPKNQGTYGANRISTVEILDDLIPKAVAAGISLGPESVIVHIDWPSANQYFEREALLRLPLTQVACVSLAGDATLSEVDRVIDGCGSHAVVISRVIARYRHDLVFRHGAKPMGQFAAIIDCGKRPLLTPSVPEGEVWAE